MTSTSYKLRLDGSTPSVGTVSADLFGSIIVNKYGWKEHIAQAADIGLTFLRFPGGTVSEVANVVDGALIINKKTVTLEMLKGDRSVVGFDLTHPELFSPDALYVDGKGSARTDVATFSEALDAAVKGDMTFNLILPVSRYYAGLDFTDPADRAAALEQAQADVTLFANRLKSGAYNDGNLPQSLLFDIGNEPYENPIEYAIVAKTMINALSSTLAGSGINYEIGFQMGTGSNSYRKLDAAGYFDTFKEASASRLASLEKIGVDVRSNISFEERIYEIDRLMISALGDAAQKIDYLRHHHLSLDIDVLQNASATFHQRQLILDYWRDALTAKGVDGAAIDYYISAWTTDGDNDAAGVYSLAAAGNILALYRNFLATDVDRAALWGLVGTFRYAPDQMPDTVISDLKSEVVSPQQAILHLLAENTIGSDLLSVGGELKFSDATQKDFLLYAFESADDYSVFVTVGDIDTKGLDIKLDLRDFGALDDVSVTYIDSVDGSSHGRARIETGSLTVKNGIADLSFDQDFEIAMLSLSKKAAILPTSVSADLGPLDKATLSMITTKTIMGTEKGETLSGSRKGDLIFGGHGNDLIDGGGGRTLHYTTKDISSKDTRAGGFNGDFLFGGSGDDIILGHDGNDWIAGGSGNDRLSGGGGLDTFVFDGGKDTITDFAYQVDTIFIDRSLTDDDVPFDQYLRQSADIVGDDLLFNLDGGHMLRLSGVADHLELVLDAISDF